MRTAECRESLAHTIRICRGAADNASPLGRTAASVLLMARSYESDGGKFLASGDPVNALASFWYAFGWLDFGISFGVLSCNGRKDSCIFSGGFDEIPHDQKEKLEEKSSRYARLLDTARTSIQPAPDPATPPYAFAETVLCIARIYSDFGRSYIEKNQAQQALACFSYGHGWIDAGVTSGLFSISANREIFTV